MQFSRSALGCRALLLVILSYAPFGFAQNAPQLFISSEKDNNISVLDADSLKVIQRIRTAERPRHLQFTPDGKQIYAACSEGDSIDIINAQTLVLEDRIVGIEDPELFDFSPDGRTLYISLEDDSALGILDLAAYFAAREEKPELDVADPAPAGAAREEDDDDDDEEKEDEAGEEGHDVAGLSIVETGAEPEGILTHPNGKTVYVASEVANIVHVVDVASREIQANIVVGNRPRRFALTPDHKALWVTNELSGSVSIIDTASNQVAHTIAFKPKGFRSEDVTPVGIILTEDGKTAIIGLGGANHIAFVDVASREIQDYVLVGKRAWNITLNADNSRAYVANGLSDDISVVDVTKRKVLKSVPVARVPHTILWRE